jgi:pimeloyl-ACP methyl ester carboxylesterase
VNLRAATIGCPDAALQMLVFMGIRAQLDAFELRRADVLASVWQAQVTVVDIPGNGHGYARLTSAERAHLRTGRFDTVADRMVAAAVEHHPRLKHSPVVALGYSMGASLATAAAARSNTLRINRLVLVEPVANRRWSISELLRSVRAEQAHVEADLDRNHNGDNDAVAARGPATGVYVRDWPDLCHLGFALTRGSLYADMLRAHRHSNCALALIHGTDSRLARRRDIKRFTHRCRSAGITTDAIEMPGHHSFWHALPDVAVAARQAFEHTRR